MDVNDGFDNLGNVDFSLVLGQPFSPFNQVLEGVVAAVLEEDVDIFLVLEGLFKFDNVFVFELSMNFDLDEKFVSLSPFVDGFFWNNLGRMDFAVLLADNFEAFGKAAGPQQFALDVDDTVDLVADDFFLL